MEPVTGRGCPSASEQSLIRDLARVQVRHGRLYAIVHVLRFGHSHPANLQRTTTDSNMLPETCSLNFHSAHGAATGVKPREDWIGAEKL